jgi:hypothetical protein
MGLSHLSADEVAALVEASCAAQGVPAKVTDPGVVRRVGALLGAPADASRAQPRSGSTRGAGGGSVAPHDVGPGRVQSLGSGDPGSDHDVVDQGFDDRVLPRQVEAAPRSA